MIQICERCYARVDPATERFYRLAHIDHADASGHVVWNHAVVHTEPCGSTTVPLGHDPARGRAA